MIARKPVRGLSVAIVALAVIVGVRGNAGELMSRGDLCDTEGAPENAATVWGTAGVMAYVLDGDTVQVTARDGRDVRVQILGIVH